MKMVIKRKLKNKNHLTKKIPQWGQDFPPWDANGGYHGKHSHGTSNACHTSKEANKFGPSIIGKDFYPKLNNTNP
jgi:hypothetical protein